MTLSLAILTLGLCLLFEAFFSGSEIALISADKVRLRHRGAGKAGRLGRAILHFLDDPGELISTSLVGTNICVVLSSVVSTMIFVEHYPAQAELLSLATITPLVLVFGEIVPKSVFQSYADRLAPTAILVLWFFRTAFYPVVVIGSWLSAVVLRILGLQGARALMSRQELSLLLRLPDPEAGIDRITADERRIISRIFDFKETTVFDVMLPLSEVTAMAVDATMEEAAQEIADKQHTRIPLYRERVDQIVGIVHAFDVLRAKPGVALCDLCRPAIFVPESAQAFDTLMRLQREGQGIAVVVDEYGGATGVVAIEDILEEIVGEIDDEYDEAERDLITREGPGSYRVLGRVPVARVNDALKLSLPVGEDYESLAGLILDQMKRIPPQGETLQLDQVSLTILKASERSIEQVRVRIGRRKGA